MQLCIAPIISYLLLKSDKLFDLNCGFLVAFRDTPFFCDDGPNNTVVGVDDRLEDIQNKFEEVVDVLCDVVDKKDNFDRDLLSIFENGKFVGSKIQRKKSIPDGHPAGPFESLGGVVDDGCTHIRQDVHARALLRDRLPLNEQIDGLLGVAGRADNEGRGLEILCSCHLA
jgi:hypothetical protein